MASELKRCPFCGNDGTHWKLEIEEFDERHSLTLYRGHCYQCGAAQHWTCIRGDAVRAWNSQWHESKIEIEHNEWAFWFGSALALALQNNYDEIDILAKEMKIDYVDGKPRLKSGVYQGEK